MMGRIKIVLVIWAALLSLATSQVPGGYYQTRFDTLDVDDVLNHKRLVHHYVACLLNRGPCPPQAADLKRILPEALENTCLRCTEKQRYIAYKMIKRLRSEYPTLWREIVDFWDPTEERIRKIESLYNKTETATDTSQNEVLFDRFNENDAQNEIAGSVKPPTETNKNGTTPSSPSSTRKTTTTSTTTTTTTTVPPFFKPLNLNTYDLPIIKTKLFHDFTRVITYGTQVAGMILQALAGQH